MRSSRPKSKANKQTLGLLNLPAELLLYCFQFFNSPAELVSLSKTCHVLRTLALDQKLWQKFNSELKFKHSEITLKSKKRITSYTFAVLTNGLICSSSGRKVILWCDNRLKPITQFTPVKSNENLSRITVLCALPENQLAIGYRNGQIQIWKLQFDESYNNKKPNPKKILLKNKKLLKILMCCSTSCSIDTLVYLPSDRLVSGGCCNGDIYIWDIKKNHYINKFHGFEVTYYNRHYQLCVLSQSLLAFHVNTSAPYQDSGILDVFADTCSYIKIWHIRTGKFIREIQVQNYIKLIHRNQKRLINTIFFLLNCHLVFTTEDFIRIFDVSSGEYEDIHVSDNISEDLNCSLLLEDKYFVTWGRVCGAIRIWDSKTGKCLKKLSIKSQRSREKFCGDLVKLNDGRLVCFNIDGVHLFNFPKFPENNLKNTPSKNIVSYPNKNCKQM